MFLNPQNAHRRAFRVGQRQRDVFHLEYLLCDNVFFLVHRCCIIHDVILNGEGKARVEHVSIIHSPKFARVGITIICHECESRGVISHRYHATTRQLITSN